MQSLLIGMDAVPCKHPTDDHRRRSMKFNSALGSTGYVWCMRSNSMVISLDLTTVCRVAKFIVFCRTDLFTMRYPTIFFHLYNHHLFCLF